MATFYLLLISILHLKAPSVCIFSFFFSFSLSLSRSLPLCANGVSSTAALASACLPLFTLHNLICVCTEHFTEENEG